MTRRRSGTSDSLYYYKWMSKAASDLRAAKILFTWQGEPALVAFHCQQTIEKALKGYILFRTGKHVDGHNLTFLCRQATRLDEKYAEWLDESAALNNLYIETRYPTDLPLTITAQDCQSYLTMAERMFTVIYRDLYEEDAPAPIVRNEGRRPPVQSRT